jgi:AcrR family transcriptional regulator
MILIEETPLRRVPQQDRGQRRVDKILEAAALLFAGVGYEAATTNAIAAKANTSIGSLYQFFPNKEAILHALATRYLEQLRAVYDTILTAETACLPLPVLLDCIIDPLVEFKLAHPGFEAIVAGAHNSPNLAATAAELHQVLIQRVEAIFAARAATLEPAQLRLYASVSVAVAEALFPLAEANQLVPRLEFVAEIKRLLLVYLGPVIGFEGSRG